MKIKKSFVTVFLSLLVTNIYAYKVIEAVTTKTGDYDIPIKILIPEKTNGKIPVYFYIHGGGWNGGTETEVPPAVVPGDANFLCDRLGIIYVGLAYRCKGNKGSFKLAIEDLEASVKWFMDRANLYNADLTRIGFGGSSAGTTLSAVMAQRYKNCKVYIGNEGMYNVADLDSTLSHFPNAEAKAKYGLVKNKELMLASPYHKLKKNPASALLLHGKDDWLCHYTQSEKYAEKISQEGGKAKVVIYENINHTCLNFHYPEVFKNSVLEIAQLFTTEFKLENVDLNAVEDDLNKRTELLYPYEDIPSDKLLGTWKDKKGTFVLKENGKGRYINSKTNHTRELAYENHGSSFTIMIKGEKVNRTFYLRKSDKFIYELILENNRWKSRRYDYRKQDTELN